MEIKKINRFSIFNVHKIKSPYHKIITDTQLEDFVTKKHSIRVNIMTQYTRFIETHIDKHV